MRVVDPIKFGKLCWPDVIFYDRQREIIYSVRDDDETVVPAGNMLGKDFVAAFVVLWFFVSRHPCRVVTTSVDGYQLEGVLWGEIRRFIQTSRYPLDSARGGLLVVNHLHLRKIVNGQIDGLSYVIGRVAAKGEGMQGHHIARTGDGIPRTLFVGDEASGLDDADYDMADTWANRKLIIGNPLPCTNFFKRGVTAGNLAADGNGHLHRRVIRIRAEGSPNVRLAHAQQAAGLQPTNRMLVPGVLDYGEYQRRRKLWDKVRQCIGLDAEFYEGAEVLLFPPDWLNLAEQRARALPATRRALTIGVDAAEGGDNTSWAIGDDLGLIALVSKKTPDTTVITGETIALMKQYSVPARGVLFDRGGGGKQHADRLRAQGFDVRTVAFGESALPDKRRGIASLEHRVRFDEERYAYRNRRAEMYGILSRRLDPAGERPYALPANMINAKRLDGGPSLREQLAPIPKQYDGEGRMWLPPKSKKSPNSTEPTMIDLIGCSPDEADALVLMTFGLEKRSTTFAVRSLI